jgi:transposase IS116/IS110/IS902 family protein
MVRVGLRDAMHAITRFPRVQDVASSGRLVNCAKEAAGTRDGTSGAKRGKTALTWAFSDAAVLLRRHHPAAQQYLARLEPTHGQGKALTSFAHTWARAVYDRRTRDTVFERQQVRNGEGGGAGAPTASRDAHGLSLACRALISSLRQGTRRRTEALWPRALGR